MEEQLETCDILKFTPNSPENFTEMRVVVETIPGVSNLADYLSLGPDTFTMAGVVCAKGQWHLNGFALFVEPKFSSISKNIDEPWDFSRHCNCDPVSQVFTYQFHSPTNQHFTRAIDREDVYINRTIEGGTRKNIVESCEFTYTCAGDGDLVVFSWENGPIPFPGQTITAKCRRPPVSHSDVMKPFVTENYWWFDNYMIQRPQITCFEK
ncbi:Monooxygenase [Caenorhabditis elegans]|uniref:Monooxygenase n=1 Tax=Caenorhabditis elegans TaxID=6239 RepID=O45895_CAEEL|nr:Monooxygenase [Caenorhabditis elegans]CAB04927.2 Monooxygenase [Caenorhabditis elegans]|eukprot:NP_507478.2 Uncharacterized protein CELE_W06D12.6 [Caenorhabditis elegans]